VERQLIDQFVSTGQVRFEYHHYIVIDGNAGGSESRRAAEASECASEQNQFWNYHKILFTNWRGEHVGAFADKRLKAFAETIGLDTTQFNRCFDSRRYANAVVQDEAAGRSLGVSSTPSLFINGQSVPQNSIFDLNYYQQVIQPLIGQ
jgi:protein-disulfide isomerase